MHSMRTGQQQNHARQQNQNENLGRHRANGHRIHHRTTTKKPTTTTTTAISDDHEDYYDDYGGEKFIF